MKSESTCTVDVYVQFSLATHLKQGCFIYFFLKKIFFVAIVWEIVFIFSLPKFVVVESVVEVRLVQDTRALQVAVDAAGDAALNLHFLNV